MKKQQLNFKDFLRYFKG